MHLFCLTSFLEPVIMCGVVMMGKELCWLCSDHARIIGQNFCLQEAHKNIQEIMQPNYWVVQKVCLGFSVMLRGNKWTLWPTQYLAVKMLFVNKLIFHVNLRKGTQRCSHVGGIGDRPCHVICRFSWLAWNVAIVLGTKWGREEWTPVSVNSCFGRWKARPKWTDKVQEK